MGFRMRWIVPFALASGAWTAQAQPVQDADLVAAREAFARSDVRALETWRARFAGHLLEPYPAYWSLAANLEKADPAQIAAFLARWPDSPLADALRRDWLKVLGTAKSWEAFRETHAKYGGEDADVQCFSFQERLARKDAEAPAEARSLFLSGREAPATCDAVFAALADARVVTQADTWTRIRRLLSVNLVRDAKRANALLPPKESFNERALERAQSQPAAFLSAEKIPSRSRAGTELTLYALARLARSKPDEAAVRLDAMASKLDAADARFAWGQIGFQAAMNHHPRALDYYEKAADAPLSDLQLMWKARAGLRAADWNAVYAAIRAMSPEEAREPNWRYWRSRAIRAKGEPEAADALLRGLAGDTHFYGLLAAEDLGVVKTPDWNGWRPQPEDLERMRARPGVARAFALYRIGLDPEAFREWFFAVRWLDDRELLTAAEAARQEELPARAINTAERTVQVHDFSQRYPLPHREALAAAALQQEVDLAWMFGLIRQESRFMPDARSSVGARGLMQLMPATARWVAKQMAVPAFNTRMLTQPDINVKMGTFYYRKVYEDLGSSSVLAAAAYNAGPGRARRWRDVQPLEGAIYAETIPFNETRDYVKKVVANTWFYTHRLTGRTASMKALLGSIPQSGTGQGTPGLP